MNETLKKLILSDGLPSLLQEISEVAAAHATEVWEENREHIVAASEGRTHTPITKVWFFWSNLQAVVLRFKSQIQHDLHNRDISDVQVNREDLESKLEAVTRERDMLRDMLLRRTSEHTEVAS